MSEPAPRLIDGLRPRATGEQDLSRLQRRNRPSVPEQKQAPAHAPASPDPNSVEDSAPAAMAPPEAAASDAATASAFQSPSESASASPSESLEEAKTRASVYLARGVQARARAAYRATAHLEGDRSWSQFIEKAIEREVQRRADAHNGGEPYAGDSTPLAPGRPIN